METVDIAAKLPHGLVLEVGYRIVNNGVVRSDKYQSFTLKGWNSNLIMAGQPAVLNPEPGITKNVPKDIWDAWVASPAGKNHPALKNGLVYVIPKDQKNAEAMAQAHSVLRSGLEPLDPNKMPEGVEEAPVEGRPRLTKVASNRG
jgi:hypothetical protein